jgi:hypothetical protein
MVVVGVVARTFPKRWDLVLMLLSDEERRKENRRTDVNIYRNFGTVHNDSS